MLKNKKYQIFYGITAMLFMGFLLQGCSYFAAFNSGNKDPQFYNIISISQNVAILPKKANLEQSSSPRQLRACKRAIKNYTTIAKDSAGCIADALIPVKLQSFYYIKIVKERVAELVGYDSMSKCQAKHTSNCYPLVSLDSSGAMQRLKDLKVNLPKST